MHRFQKPPVSKLLQPMSRVTVRWVLAAACVAGLGVTGCDQVKQSSITEADNRVDANLRESELHRGRGGEKAAKDAMTALTNAANEAGASPESKAHAKGELGRVEFAQAMRLLPEVERKQQQMSEMQWQMRQAADRVETARLMKSSYEKADPEKAPEKGEMPKAPKAALDEQAAAIKAAFDKADAEVKALQTDLDKRKADIEAMKQEKTKDDTEAAALEEKSNAVKGKESLDLFKQASDLRQKGGELGAKIDVATLELLPVERGLAIAEQQKLAWDNKSPDAPGAQQGLDAARQQTESIWSDRKTAMETVDKNAKATADQITANSAKLAKLAGETKTARDDIAAKLTAAAKHLGEAADAAKTLREELNARMSDARASKSPQVDAWKSTLRTYDEAGLRLQQGSAQLQLAELHLAHANELTRRKATADYVSGLLKGAGQTAPADLFPDTAAKELDAARAEAAKGFNAAETALDTATKLADEEPVKTSARLMAMESRTSHLPLLDEGEPKKRVGETLAEDQKWASDNNINLPQSLGGKPPTTAPAEK